MPKNKLPTLSKEQFATIQMVYHLTQAAKHFENTHDDNGALAREVIRTHMADGFSTAAEIFVNYLVKYYDELGKEIEGAIAVNDNEEEK